MDKKMLLYEKPIFFASFFEIYYMVLEDVEKFEEVDLVAKPFSLDYLIDLVETKVLKNQVMF